MLDLEERRLLATTFTVTTAADSGPGSLRQAITDADSSGAASVIDFNVAPAGSPQTIWVSSAALPDVTVAVDIEGQTQGGPGYQGAPLITIYTLAHTAKFDGLALGTGSDGSKIAGLSIEGVSGNGIRVDSNHNTIGGTAAGAANVISGNSQAGIVISGWFDVVVGNRIGTDVDGTVDIPNYGDGIDIRGDFNTVGGTATGTANVISGNHDVGIVISTNYNVIEGNRIGTDAVGAHPLPNFGGVNIQGFGNTLGGTTAGAGNIISGNYVAGVLIPGAFNLVEGNLIGTDATGTTSVFNHNVGVAVQFSGNTIGGTAAGARNVISGNLGVGILLSGPYNLVEGDFIGTDASGTENLPNTTGVEAQVGPNTIGGSTTGAGDVISGNFGPGILISGEQMLVEGDRIGVDAQGTADLANIGDGVHIQGRSNTIGGTAPGAGNLVSGNDGDGIFIADAYNLVEGDRIGTDTRGTAALPNLGDGIDVHLPYYSAWNTIGGAAPGAGNLISGNDGDGILIASSATRVEGNFIGTDASGTAALPNLGDGVDIPGSGNTIGATAGAANVISGNKQAGVQLTTSAAFNNLIEGDLIGTAADAESALPNATGVQIDTGASFNQIGGTVAARSSAAGAAGPSSVRIRPTTIASAAGAGQSGEATGASGYTAAAAGADNVISGNAGSGIFIFTGSLYNVVVGNLIGTDGSGQRPLGNGIGVEIDAASFNTVGSQAAGYANVISGNTAEGVEILNSAAGHNDIKGNWLGLGGDGRTPVRPPDLTAGMPIGVLIEDSPGNTVGGWGAGAANVLAGFGVGIQVSGSNAAGNAVIGNVIGTGRDGQALPGSIGIGIYLENVANSTVGGMTARSGNVIVGYSQYGVFIYGPQATANAVQGNRIGAGVPSPSSQLAGIAVEDSSGNTLGGQSSSAGNTISGNFYAGIYVLGQGNTGIPGNAIAQNVLDHNTYGILLYNDTIDGSYSTLEARNRFAHSGIANIREFSGPVPSAEGASQANQSGGHKRARRAHTHPKPAHRPRHRPSARHAAIVADRRSAGGEGSGSRPSRPAIATTGPRPAPPHHPVRIGEVVPGGPMTHRSAARLSRPASAAHASRDSGRTAS
jgi:titin